MQNQPYWAYLHIVAYIATKCYLRHIHTADAICLTFVQEEVANYRIRGIIGEPNIWRFA